VEYRLKLSTRALREVGEARDWYEQQNTGLGEAFLAETESQLEKIQETPLLYAEPIPNVRCSHVRKFPYSIFYTIRGDLVFVLSVLGQARSPRRRPRVR
jgi:toxin ParE1/3/4